MILLGRGVKAKMDVFLTEPAGNTIDWIKKIAANPQKLAEVALGLSVSLKMEISSGQLKRFIQEKLSYTWRRLRQWLKPKQEPVEYRQCYNSLQDLKKLDESGYLDLF